MSQPSAGIRIIVEDQHLIGLVKPAGLPTANAARGAPSVFTVLQRRRAAGAFLGVVSRLDAPVSGVLVMAKTREAAASLAAQFRERGVRKRYLAVVTGRFPAPEGLWVDWHDSISRRPGERRSSLGPAASVGIAAPADDDEAGTDEAAADEAASDEAGTLAGPARAGGARRAHVRCRVVRRAGEVSLVELEPTTGRRHQLRLQLASRGCPIVGDRLYGSRLPFPGGGIALHASRLECAHPATGEGVLLESGRPDGWREMFPSLWRTSGRS